MGSNFTKNLKILYFKKAVFAVGNIILKEFNGKGQG